MSNSVDVGDARYHLSAGRIVLGENSCRHPLVSGNLHLERNSNLLQADARQSACNMIRRALYGVFMGDRGKGWAWERLGGPSSTDLKYVSSKIRYRGYSHVI
jgi:hypothetical protein